MWVGLYSQITVLHSREVMMLERNLMNTWLENHSLKSQLLNSKFRHERNNSQISLCTRNSFWREKPTKAVTRKLFTWSYFFKFLEGDKIYALHVGITSFRNQISVFIHEWNCVFPESEKVLYKWAPIITYSYYREVL